MVGINTAKTDPSLIPLSVTSMGTGLDNTVVLASKFWGFLINPLRSTQENRICF